MASILEIRVEQRKWLFKLLQLKKAYQTYDSKPINEVIAGLVAEMDAEDVAYVEKTFAELP